MIEIYILLFVLVFVLAYELQRHIPDSACHGDCEQGRRCTCVKPEE